MILSQFSDLAYRAHCGTSFSPEKRGASYIAEHSAELLADLQTLRDAAEKHNVPADRLESTLSWYEEKYKRLFAAWMSAKSRCLSPMITGPARFPTARNAKHNNWERSAYETFAAWREKALRVVSRRMVPRATAESEVQRYEKKLAALTRLQELMKAANKILRAAKGSDCTDKLIAAGFSAKSAAEVQKPDYCNRVGFQSYSLTNNNAMIKDVTTRLAQAKKREAAVNSGDGIREIALDGCTVVINRVIDRLQIIHPSKPERDVIEKLKRSGFRWSPAGSCWQRQLTNAAYYAAAEALNVPSSTFA